MADGDAVSIGSFGWKVSTGDVDALSVGSFGYLVTGTDPGAPGGSGKVTSSVVSLVMRTLGVLRGTRRR